MMNLRNPRHLSAAVTVLAVVLSAAAWLLLVSPKRSEASRLVLDVESARAELVRSRTEADNVRGIAGVAPMPLLERAIPDDAGTASVLLELTRVGAASGVSFTAVTPQPAVAGNGLTVRPFDATFEGDFEHVSAFLAGLRKLVAFENRNLRATGRLYSIDSIDLSEGERKFPYLKASLRLNAFQYGTQTTPAAAAPSASTPES